jgi:hypothetical protein
MPNQVDGVLMRAMSGYELSRVRTELYRLPILPTVPPHPVQPHGDSSCQGYLGDVFFSAHRRLSFESVHRELVREPNQSKRAAW